MPVCCQVGSSEMSVLPGSHNESVPRAEPVLSSVEFSGCMRQVKSQHYEAPVFLQYVLGILIEMAALLEL